MAVGFLYKRMSSFRYQPLEPLSRSSIGYTAHLGIPSVGRQVHIICRIREADLIYRLFGIDFMFAQPL